MSKSIPISPKHGLNPSMPICFFCGETKNEIALLGKIDRKDSEAPRHILLDYEPCEKCQELMNQGITLIEVEEQPVHPNQPPIAKNLYPSGMWHIVTEDFVKEHFQPEEMVNNVLKKRKCFIPKGLIQTTEENK